MIGARVAAARAIAVAAVVIAGGALGSCRQARPPVVRPGPPPSAEQLLATLAARQNALRGVNARARPTSWLGGGPRPRPGPRVGGARGPAGCERRGGRP